MKPRGWLFWALAAIAAGTVGSGLAQLVAPGIILDLVGAQATTTSSHFFAIVGMFMAIFGAAMLHALFSPDDHPVVVFWAAVQKLGAFVAVSVGVVREVFSPMAFAVAGFDLLSGALALAYWVQIRKTRTGFRRG